jgi:hypothetical protein
VHAWQVCTCVVNVFAVTHAPPACGKALVCVRLAATSGYAPTHTSMCTCVCVALQGNYAAANNVSVTMLLGDNFCE